MTCEWEMTCNDNSVIGIESVQVGASRAFAIKRERARNFTKKATMMHERGKILAMFLDVLVVRTICVATEDVRFRLDENAIPEFDRRPFVREE